MLKDTGPNILNLVSQNIVKNGHTMLAMQNYSTQPRRPESESSF